MFVGPYCWVHTQLWCGYKGWSSVSGWVTAPFVLLPSDGVFGRFDLAALRGCHTLNDCLFDCPLAPSWVGHIMWSWFKNGSIEGHGRLQLCSSVLIRLNDSVHSERLNLFSDHS
jgi:hypothetical protein